MHRFIDKLKTKGRRSRALRLDHEQLLSKAAAQGLSLVGAPPDFMAQYDTCSCYDASEDSDPSMCLIHNP